MRTVMGVDPGNHSLGVCVLKDGKVSQILQLVTPDKDRKKSEAKRWVSILCTAIDDARPDVIGLEDVEPQPWVANGRVPKGLVALQRLVADMRNSAQVRGILVYTQSPNIQVNYDTVYVEALIRRAYGRDIRITPHLISATKHALYADSMYCKSRLVREDG